MTPMLQREFLVGGDMLASFREATMGRLTDILDAQLRSGKRLLTKLYSVGKIPAKKLRFIAKSITLYDYKTSNARKTCTT